MTPKVEVKVLNYKWTIRLLTKREYQKKNGKDSLAITKAWKRTIDLSPRGRDRETIIHELVHAYLSEMLIYSLDLNSDYLEEVFAELLSKRGYELLSKAQEVFEKVRALV